MVGRERPMGKGPDLGWGPLSEKEAKREEPLGGVFRSRRTIVELFGQHRKLSHGERRQERRTIMRNVATIIIMLLTLVGDAFGQTSRNVGVYTPDYNDRSTRTFHILARCSEAIGQDTVEWHIVDRNLAHSYIWQIDEPTETTNLQVEWWTYSSSGNQRIHYGTYTPSTSDLTRQSGTYQGKLNGGFKVPAAASNLNTTPSGAVKIASEKKLYTKFRVTYTSNQSHRSGVWERDLVFDWNSMQRLCRGDDKHPEPIADLPELQHQLALQLYQMLQAILGL